MIQYATGDMWERYGEPGTVMVLAANCAGVMGAGQVKPYPKRDPAGYDCYRRLCSIKPITPEEWRAFKARQQEENERLGIVPIPAICTGKRKHEWIDAGPGSNGAIRAPSLKGCQCFWCGAPLRPHPNYQPKQMELI